MEATKTLELIGNSREREMAYEILKDNAGLFGDNGGDSDGNLWLPSSPISESEDGVDVILGAVFGQMVYAFYYDNFAFDEIAKVMESYGLTSPRMFAEQSERADSIEYDDVRDALEAAVDEGKIRGFAGYSSSNTFAVIWTK